jgi:fucose 4-O-acetylase-like acetyltransferase
VNKTESISSNWSTKVKVSLAIGQQNWKYFEQLVNQTESISGNVWLTNCQKYFQFCSPVARNTFSLVDQLLEILSVLFTSCQKYFQFGWLIARNTFSFVHQLPEILSKVFLAIGKPNWKYYWQLVNQTESIFSNWSTQLKLFMSCFIAHDCVCTASRLLCFKSSDYCNEAP